MHKVFCLVVDEQSVVGADEHAFFSLQQTGDVAVFSNGSGLWSVVESVLFEVLQIDAYQSGVVSYCPQALLFVDDGLGDERLLKCLVEFFGERFIHFHGFRVQKIGAKTIGGHQFVVLLGVVNDSVAGETIDAVFALSKEDMLKVHRACIEQEESMRGADPEFAVSCFAHAVRHLKELSATFGGRGKILEFGTIEETQCVCPRHPR